MFKADLANARRAWLDAAHGPEERLRREQSDFLAELNHDGEVAEFHCLRHTCGAWLARAGSDPKTIQSIMRHSAITLTMDTYGHLFPGQEADAVASLPGMFGSGPEALAATGTNGRTNVQRGQKRGQLGGKTGQDVATGGEAAKENETQGDEPKTLKLCTLGDDRQHLAKGDTSRPGGSRTPDQGIMSPQARRR